MTRTWNYVPLTSKQQKQETELDKRFANCQPISELLVERGITTIDAAERFFHPSLGDMHDPFLLDGMAAAVDCINSVMGRKEKIRVFGDYDVDGTTAVALVYKYLSN